MEPERTTLFSKSRFYGFIAIRAGLIPTAIVAMTVLVAPSMTETFSIFYGTGPLLVTNLKFLPLKGRMKSSMTQYIPLTPPEGLYLFLINTLT